MITPIELSRIKFNQSFRGYDVHEVEEFIIRISQDYEKLFAENQALKKKLGLMENKLAGYAEMETNLKKTLVSAQKTSTEVREDAVRKSDIILREAELNAERVVEEARQEARELTNKIRMLKRQKKLVRDELLGVIKRYHDLLETEDDERKERS
ncbi:MAG: DivIVA domain-containing protein [Candidatus Wallbacteria bacterium]|nr:DivIVA domain-containing protein [Candidatus Wallbacteria bacterium]